MAKLKRPAPRIPKPPSKATAAFSAFEAELTTAQKRTFHRIGDDIERELRVLDRLPAATTFVELYVTLEELRKQALAAVPSAKALIQHWFGEKRQVVEFISGLGPRRFEAYKTFYLELRRYRKVRKKK